MPSVRRWQTELRAIADELERSALQWSLDHAEVDKAAERLGTAGEATPWAMLPQAELVMQMAGQLRFLIASLDEVPEVPQDADDA